MEQSVNLLQNVSEAARMGIDSIETLMTKTNDESMRQELLRQRSQYEKAEREAQRQLSQVGAKPKSKGPMAKAGAWMGIQMDTLVDQSNSHLADMLIQGSTMGVIDLTRAQARNPEADENAKRVAAEYLKNENESIERMKGFL